jgi:hypothetical protein
LREYKEKSANALTNVHDGASMLRVKHSRVKGKTVIFSVEVLLR